jgi:hypothetical protein
VVIEEAEGIQRWQDPGPEGRVGAQTEDSAAAPKCRRHVSLADGWLLSGMDAGTIVGIYGAALSSMLAGYQVITQIRDRPRLKVTADFRFQPLKESQKDAAVGTPTNIRRGRDVHLEEVLVVFTISNEGGAALQIFGVVVESLTKDLISISEITQSPLPHVLEPRTSIRVPIQKEFIDQNPAITFLGIVDALGRRHGIPRERARDLIFRSWSLPTRVAVYQRRDDPDEKVRAFQARTPASISSRPIEPGRHSPKILAARTDLSQPSPDVIVTVE